jgi:hypothetical protein
MPLQDSLFWAAFLNPIAMYSIKKQFAIIVTACMVLCACNGKNTNGANDIVDVPTGGEVPNGGYCGYRHTYHPVVLHKITNTAVKGTSYDLMLFRADDMERKDTLRSSILFYGTIMKKDLDSLNIKLGDTLVIQHDEIIKGHCSPNISRLQLRPYNAATDTAWQD